MQRSLPVKRRRVRVRSRSPTPVHYIDLTTDSPVIATTTTAAVAIAAHTRRRLNDNNDIKSSSSNETNQGAPSRRMETIDIPDTPESVRSRIPKKLSNNTNLIKSTTIPIDDFENNEDPGDRIPAVNDSLDGITPTVLSCPICYEDLRSSRKPMTTKCGHLFCESCIQATLSSRKKCPVCMASITIKSCIRVHF
ncbi:hypothetical protein PV328_009138 [Microctonus aethiopoides]|uniref:RING-type domain-containing protein n=1 Tax=Microctonus aethiopoides TaxID=144406 RepID=A0AA39KRZ3_9HYME|nr:hypothetical protein PV328_009138 [Microctonus aethiopoides]